jgi:hypothetical protein
MTDPTPTKPLDWHGFLRILSAHEPRTTLSANTIHADACAGVQIDPKRLGALFKAAADAGYIRLVGAENAAREESKGHLIRTWKRTRKAIPAHVCEVSAA